MSASSNNIGPYKRLFPRIRVRRGWDPQNPMTRSEAHPVLTDTVTGMPAVIWSGMVMTLSADNKFWVPGLPDAQAATATFFAIAQDDSNNEDVLASNRLPGLDCSGQYTLDTALFARQKKGSSDPYVYTPGTKLTPCKTSEIDVYRPKQPSAATLAECGVSSITEYISRVPEAAYYNQTAERSAAGFLRPAKAGEPIVAEVRTAPFDLQPSVLGTTDTTAVDYDSYFITIVTTRV